MINAKDLKKGDKFKFEYGDFDNCVFMKVEDIRNDFIYCKVIKCCSIDYTEGQIIPIDINTNWRVELVDDAEMSKSRISEAELLSAMLRVK